MVCTAHQGSPNPLGPHNDTSPQGTTSQQANHVGHNITPHLQPPPGFKTAIPTPLQPWQNVRTPSAQDICAQMYNQVEYMSHAHHTFTKAEVAEYHHQSLFSPPEVTLIQAIKNEQLKSFPGLTAELISKHLPQSIATYKGHMH